MSRITESDAKGLMEAYNAVYAFQEQPQQLTEQTTKENYIQEDLEIDPDALLESVKEYLVTSGYAKGEKEAINMLPHLSENFFQNICSQIIITEVFYQNVNSLVEEGYDLSEYTWDELFESYVNVIDQETLNEAIPLAIPAAMAAAPYVLPALGAAAYTAKGLMDRRNKSQAKQKAEDEKFLSTGSFAASKEAERRGREAAELNRKQNQPTQPTSTTVSGQTIKGERPRIRVAATRPQGSTTSTSGASVQQPKPPEPSAKDLGGEITRQSTTPGQSSASSSTSAPSGGAPAGGAPPTPPSGGGGGKPPKGPNWFQRQLTDIQRGRAQEKGAGTAERLGRVIGSGEKIAKGSAEWAGKNLIARPLGVLAGGGIIGGVGYGAYKGSEELIKKFGPGVVKKGKELLNPPAPAAPAQQRPRPVTPTGVVK